MANNNYQLQHIILQSIDYSIEQSQIYINCVLNRQLSITCCHVYGQPNDTFRHQQCQGRYIHVTRQYTALCK